MILLKSAIGHMHVYSIFMHSVVDNSEVSNMNDGITDGNWTVDCIILSKTQARRLSLSRDDSIHPSIHVWLPMSPNLQLQNMINELTTSPQTRSAPIHSIFSAVDVKYKTMPLSIIWNNNDPPALIYTFNKFQVAKVIFAQMLPCLALIMLIVKCNSQPVKGINVNQIMFYMSV